MNISQIKKQKNKFPEIEVEDGSKALAVKTEISNQPDKDFKEMVIKILTQLESKIEKLRENFNRKYKIEPSTLEEYNNQNKKCRIVNTMKNEK